MQPQGAADWRSPICYEGRAVTVEKFVYVALAVVLVTIVLPMAGKRVLVDRLARRLEKGQFDAFLKTVDGPVCRVLFSAYEREFLRLNVCSLRGDAAGTDRQYQKLLGMKLRSVRQERALVLNAFSYYLNAGNEARTTELLPRLKEAAGEEEYRRYEMMYRVAILKKADCIKEMEAQLPGEDAMNQSVLHYMISLQYGYLGDRTRSAEHLRLSRMCSDRALRAAPGAQK